MSKQRIVKDNFWTDGYVEKLTPDEKLIFLYLLTNPLCNIAGIYEIRSKRIAFETGYDIEVIDTILKRFKKDKKIILFNDWIIIINFVKNQSNNPSVIKGVQRILDNLPKEVQAVTDCDSLSYLTLLNLTLPNSTLPNGKKKADTFLNKQITQIIDEFSKWTPSAKTWYKNTTQRNACKLLIEHYGIKEVIKMIENLPKVNRLEYVSTATTPKQLLDKAEAIKAQLSKLKNNQPVIL